MSVLDERIGPFSLGQTASGAVPEEPNQEGIQCAVTHAEHVDDFDMRHLRYFLTVVRSGTVSAAAKELRISQPSLSQQIKRLEQRIGAALFVRSPRGVELTAGGRAFLREIQGIPGQLRSAIAAAAPTPTVWPVGVCGGVPAEVLTKVQNGLGGQGPHPIRGRPGPQLRMRSVGAADQPELLEHGEIVFGIVRLPVTTPRLARAVVWDEPLGVVLPATHPLADRPRLTWEDLSTQRLLWYDEGCAPGYADAVPAQLTALGWNAVLHPVDQDQQALFVHALQTTRDLVALRPSAAVTDDPQLVWRPLPTAAAPRERLAVTALSGSRAARYLGKVAAQRGWPYHA
ncbi:LysR family transcriptional regulator [Streptomyces sp. S.PNR 29]|uniref:LysR family transcriptional regulator n=1 Tax=Streptomyces sp. S.PNR 29 TaxID=2973805 RepID=UPI0025B27BBD|nr:LysR family transcriptional regulator [Streptomyces sp. S.PNR 29]MDN0193478.1 LysR family transcriptional regulator [Streptomyces sp. S.PNR 29]